MYLFIVQWPLTCQKIQGILVSQFMANFWINFNLICFNQDEKDSIIHMVILISCTIGKPSDFHLRKGFTLVLLGRRWVFSSTRPWSGLICEYLSLGFYIIPGLADCIPSTHPFSCSILSVLPMAFMISKSSQNWILSNMQGEKTTLPCVSGHHVLLICLFPLQCGDSPKLSELC